ncbi:MAG TPA: tetratricopeptide repeat protein [Fimbriimonas sp.]|nr:tetratricopeptide repeat protein [Fimbriimonas sp.]
MSNVGDVTMMGSVTMDDRQLLQADLARVNMLRIRGDISSAKTLCLSILKRFPESADAHVMMGDLHSEQADLLPAAEWYALALDLDRTAPGVEIKLQRIRAAIDISNQADRSKFAQITSRKTSPWLYLAIFTSIIGIGTVAYIAGSQKPPANDQRLPIRERITTPLASGTSTPTAVASSTPPTDIHAGSTGPVPDQSPVMSPNVAANKGGKTDEEDKIVGDDATLYEQISKRTGLSKHIISVMADPRSNSILLTFNVRTEDHGRYTGAVLADTAMEYDLKVLKVTLRGVRNGILSYMGDVTREKILEIELREGKDVKELSDHGWINEALTNEYYKKDQISRPEL